MTPLSYPQKRLLSAIEAHPGLSRAELAKLLYSEMNPYYSGRKVCKMVKALEKRGLVEFDVIHEGGRTGVPGVYMVGQKRKTKPGYLGVFGWVDERDIDASAMTNTHAVTRRKTNVPHSI